jgi:hypothetical protein
MFRGRGEEDAPPPVFSALRPFGARQCHSFRAFQPSFAERCGLAAMRRQNRPRQGSVLTPLWWPLLSRVAQAKSAHHLGADRPILWRVSAVLGRERNRLCLFLFSLFSI